MDYARAIVEHFVVLRGKGSAVSSADEALLLGWERDGFPLEIVLEGIDLAYERKREPPKSLTECGRWVRAGFKKWSEDFDEGSAVSTPAASRPKPHRPDDGPLPGLPPAEHARLSQWRTSGFLPLQAAAEEMWRDLVAQVEADGVVAGEVVAIIEDAVRLIALDNGATEAELADQLG